MIVLFTIETQVIENVKSTSFTLTTLKQKFCFHKQKSRVGLLVEDPPIALPRLCTEDWFAETITFVLVRTANLPSQVFVEQPLAKPVGVIISLQDYC